jgi:hypothetical protein
MYESNDAYLAESTGLSIGRRQGYEQGYAVGHADGNNAAVASWQEQITLQWEPLVDRLTAERDDLLRQRDELLVNIRHAERETQQWHYGFYSMLCALKAAMDVLQAGPQDTRTRMILEFAKRAEAMKADGWIDSMPQDNATVRARAPKTADQLQSWWNQVLAQAKRTATPNDSPSQ